MTKEVSNLIKENNELLETKYVQNEYWKHLFDFFVRNALNVLKDDLLVKIEELSKYDNQLFLLKENVYYKI